MAQRILIIFQGDSYTYKHTIKVSPHLDVGFLKPYTSTPPHLVTRHDVGTEDALGQVAKVVGSNFSLQRAEHVLCQGQTMAIFVLSLYPEGP